MVASSMRQAPRAVHEEHGRDGKRGRYRGGAGLERRMDPVRGCVAGSHATSGRGVSG